MTDDATEYEPEATPARRRVHPGARVLAGTLGLVLAAATISTAALAPLPSVTATPANVVITPVPTAQQLVCPGSFLRLGNRNGQDATDSVPLGNTALVYATTAGEIDDEALSPTTGAPRVVTTVPEDGATDAPLSSATQAQSFQSTDYSGLAATECATVTGDSWLVGGSTRTGRNTVITLTNPGDVPSTVDLEVFGEEGLLDTPGSTGITVPAGSQVSMSLAGYAPDIASPVVHVTSTGGQIVANLQQSIVRGLTPSGVDLIGRTALPAQHQVIPGLVTVGASRAGELVGAEDFADLATALRVYVPGDEPAEATVSITKTDGSAAGDPFEITLDAGLVTDVPIESLGDGNYTLTLDTSVPVVAGARVSSVGVTGRTDLAWLAVPTTIDSPTAFSAITAQKPKLYVANTSDAVVDLTLTSEGGGVRDIALEAGASASVPLVSANYTIEGTGDFVASVGYAATRGIANYVVRPAPELAGPITIYP